MIQDILTVMWKERRERAGVHNGLRAKLVGMLFPLLTLGILAVLPPLAVGPGWVSSPFIFIASVFVPFMMAISSVSESFAGERERKTLETLLATRLPDRAILFGKMAVPVLDGLVATVFAHLVSLFVLNAAFGGGLLLYHPGMALLVVVLAVAVAVFSTAVGVLMSLRAPTVQQATLNLMVAFMAPSVLLLVTAYFMAAAFPGAWGAAVERLLTGGLLRADLAELVLLAVGLLALLDVALVLIAVSRFKRARLGLE
jgi:ABC-2 type transport system permease protein